MKKKSAVQKWKLLKSEPGEDLSIFRVRFDHLVNPRNQTELRATVLESNDSANVVAITENDEIVLVRQYRFGIQDYTLELPGGFIDQGENHLTAVQRELSEETGYTGKEWEYLGSVQANPVFMDSVIYQYVARNVAKTDVVQLDEGEDVEVVVLSKSEVIKRIKNGEIAHPHSLTALMKVLSIWS
ncbi:MAG: NUDIX hydrolase [Saprospiraceae bacterium]